MENTTENGGSNFAQQYNSGDYLPEEGLLQIILRHRWTVLITTLILLALGFIYILKATPIYTSSSRVYVEQRGPRIISDFEGVMTQSKNYLYTQGQIITSSPVITKVADDRRVQRLRTFNRIDNLISYIKNNLEVGIGKKDDIITVSFDSPYPEEAAQIVNKAVNSYIEYQSGQKRSTVSEVVKLLRKEKTNRDRELAKKFEELLKFTRENGIVSFDDRGGNIVYQTLLKLGAALTEAQLASINARADYGALQSMADEPEKIKQFAISQPSSSVRVLTGDVETHLKSELRDAEVELENIKYYVTPDHPSVKALSAKIEYINRLLDRDAKEFAKVYMEVARLKLVTAQQRENELQLSFNTQKEKTQEAGVQATEFMVIQSELKRIERLCDILDNRIKELNVTEDSGALNISILEVARAAEKPSKPKRAKIMAMALFLGLMLGSGLAMIRDWLDYRLRSAEEVTAMLGIPVLGIVPTMTAEQTIARHSHKAWIGFKTTAFDTLQKITKAVLFVMGVSKADTSESKLSESVEKTSAKEIVARGRKVCLHPKSVIAESYRTIRTAVFFGAPKADSKLIHVTSPESGDGKSTLVSNLAIAMAQAGQKTLIIDADFRKPTQHRIFEIDTENGIATILAEMCTIDQAIQKGPVDGLDILCGGAEMANPSETLNSNAFSELLKNLSERYDRIIIDSPPVGPVTDSRIIAALSDIVILVLRAEKSGRKHSRDACDSLLSVGGRVLGAVVNDVSRRWSGYGRYGRYGRYGKYGGYGSYGSYGSYGYYGEKEKVKV